MQKIAALRHRIEPVLLDQRSENEFIKETGKDAVNESVKVE